jgi:hypothetical protein
VKKLLCVVVWLFPALMFAQSPFDGTWKTDMGASKLSQKPYVFSLNHGAYTCDSCAPKLINVKADGNDQPVTGQTYDTLTVQVVSPSEVRFILKKGGKTTSDSTRSVSDDGKTLTIKGTNYPADGSAPVKTDVKFARIASGPAGSNVISGSWRIQNITEDAAGLTTTWKVAADEVSMKTGDGLTWQAKFGGPEQPVQGTYTDEKVSVKKLGAREIEVTYTRDGKPYIVNRVTVSADGKKITEVSDNKWTNRISTYIDEKQ